jgi:mono/diheme cytochrome c family protein
VKKFLAGFATAFVLLPFAVLAYFGFGMSEIGSDTKPPVWETWLMQSAVRTTVRRSAKELVAPVPANQESIIAGGKLYLAGCAGCHGEPGKPYEEDHVHYPPVPQLPYTGSQYSEPEIVWIIKHGVRLTAMSAYGPFYKEHEVWALAAFIHRINALSVDEIQAIKQKNH